MVNRKSNRVTKLVKNNKKNHEVLQMFKQSDYNHLEVTFSSPSPWGQT